MGMSCVVRAVQPAEVQQLETDPESIEQLLLTSRDSGNNVHLEKSWHGLHYLLTGSAAEP